MADNTLPAWMQQLSGQSAGTYIPDGQGGYYGVLGSGISTNPVTGETDPYAQNGYSYYHIAGDGNTPGQAYSIFNKDGSLQGNYTTSADHSGFGDFAKAAALAAAAVYGAGALGAGGAGAGGAGTAGGLDSANGVLNSAVMSGGSGATGSLGAGVAGAADAAGAGGSGALQTLGGIPQVDIPAASTFTDVSTLGSGLPSWMSAASPWLKVAAPILGAIAGSKGVKTNSTQTSNINPQVAPYVYGSGGLLGGVQGLLGQQTGNGAQQVQQAGLGLLNQPVAGNGFSRFFPNR